MYNKDKTILIACPSAKSGEFDIPESVKSIGQDAFSSCSSLTSVSVYNAEQKQWMIDAGVAEDSVTWNIENPENSDTTS